MKYNDNEIIEAKDKIADVVLRSILGKNYENYFFTDDNGQRKLLPSIERKLEYIKNQVDDLLSEHGI